MSRFSSALSEGIKSSINSETLLKASYNVTQSTGIYTFDLTDYTLFIVMLLISAAIGVYFGFFSKSKNTTDEYLLGSKQMKAIPIAISLIASQLSAISIMAVPAESYTFGFNYIIVIVMVIVVMPVTCHVIVPVFYKNNLSNCYEYLGLRFNKSTRQIVTASFVLSTLLMLPIYMFVPSLAFSQVTGINVHLINMVVSFICIFYTMWGGIKAVVWTDVVQAAIMIFSVVLVGVLGIIKTGGLSKVIELAVEGGRMDFNFSLDPRTRITVWNAFVGGIFMWLGNVAFTQSCVQRLVSLRSIQQARKALYIGSVGILAIMGLSSFIGIIMYAYYHGCDPLATGRVTKPDKMLPFFVQDVLGHLKGMPGLFISCVFSAALSTFSAVLNSLAGVVYFDYIRPFIKHTDAKANSIMKLFIFVTGIYCVSAGYIVQSFNSIVQTITTITGITVGSITGVFLLGMFVPRVNGKVAAVSVSISVIVMIWIVVMSQLRFKTGLIRYDVLPTRTDLCEAQGFHMVLKNSTTTTMATPVDRTTEITQITTAFTSNRSFSIFDVAFLWYKLMGMAMVWLIAIPLSYVWLRHDDEKWDPKLYSPFVKKLIRYRTRKLEEMPLKIPEDTKKPIQVKVAKENI